MRRKKHHNHRDEAPQPSLRGRHWLTLETIGIALIAFLIEAWGMVQIASTPEVDVWQIMLLHIRVSGFLLVWLALTFLRKKTGPEPTILALTTCALGPLGSVGVLIMYAIYFLFSKQSQGFIYWYTGIHVRRDTL